MQTFGSQVWDASFFLQALLASNLSDEIGLTLMKGHDFLKRVRDNLPRDFKRVFRHIFKGSWTLSDQDHGWQVSDCTAEALKCCLYFARMAPEMISEKMDTEHIFYDVHMILSLQSKNGGFTPWELAGGGFWWEVIFKFLEDLVVEHEHESAHHLQCRHWLLSPNYTRNINQMRSTIASKELQSSLKRYSILVVLGMETWRFASFYGT
ncbi:camelliol C synthase 1 [Hibiscus trionum]|uniref:Camelliol C synthase 1 n=1 Tax=Hibiscus trionum TaxID=183268 RepID=A0A9W7I5D7_HIBTR|nr:camelliol C synthase 1 [Hibiscus trionum]